MNTWTALEKGATPFNHSDFHDYFFTLLNSERDDFELLLTTKMNNFLCCCPNGASGTAIWMYRDSDEEFIWAPLKKEAAQQIFGNFIYKKPKGKKSTIDVTAFDIWMKSPMRRHVDNIVFDPYAPPGFVTDGSRLRYNLWEGLELIQITDEDKAEEQLATIIFHLKEVLCRGNEEIYEYVIQWLAAKVQDPGRKIPVALVFTGAQGTGKSVFWEHVTKRIFGRHGFTLPDASLLTHQFAGQVMSNRVFLVVNETKFEKLKDANHLKNMISSETIKAETKFQNMKIQKNYLNIVMTSNCSLSSFPAEPGSNRRYCPVEADPSRANRQDYFDVLLEALRGEGMHAFHRFLLAHSVTLNLNLPPHTEEKSEAVTYRFNTFEDFWLSCLNNHTHESPTSLTVDPQHRWWATEGCNIQNTWRLFQIRYPRSDLTEVRFQNELKGVLPPLDPGQKGPDLATALGNHEKFFTMPGWKSCNEHFSVLKGIRNIEDHMVKNKKRRFTYDPENDRRKRQDIRSHFLK